jgi:hypothetical protein
LVPRYSNLTHAYNFLLCTAGISKNASIQCSTSSYSKSEKNKMFRKQSFKSFSKSKHLRRKKQQLAQTEITSFLRPTFLLRYFSKLHFFTNFFFGVDKLTIRDTWRQSSRRLSVSTTRSDLQVSNRSAFKLR